MQIDAPRSAGEDRGEAVVADLHEYLGELRRGCEPGRVDVVEARAQQENGARAAQDEPRAGSDPAAPLAGVEQEDRSTLVRHQAAGGDVSLVEEVMVAFNDEAQGLGAGIDGDARGEDEAARRGVEPTGARTSSRGGERVRRKRDLAGGTGRLDPPCREDAEEGEERSGRKGASEAGRDPHSVGPPLAAVSASGGAHAGRAARGRRAGGRGST